MFVEPGSEPYFLAAFAIFWIGCALWALFALWMVIDCLLYEPSVNHSKIIWLLIILFGVGVGPIIYFFSRRRERQRGSIKT